MVTDSSKGKGRLRVDSPTQEGKEGAEYEGSGLGSCLNLRRSESCYVQAYNTLAKGAKFLNTASSLHTSLSLLNLPPRGEAPERKHTLQKGQEEVCVCAGVWVCVYVCARVCLMCYQEWTEECGRQKYLAFLPH